LAAQPTGTRNYKKLISRESVPLSDHFNSYQQRERRAFGCYAFVALREYSESIYKKLGVAIHNSEK